MVYAIDFGKMKDEELKDYHEMMDEVTLKVDKVSPLAVGMWSAVLKELDKRQLVRLVSGSYDDVGNAAIQKLW